MHQTPRPTRVLITAAVMVVWGWIAQAAPAQLVNPVYPDDSTVAVETLVRVRDLVRDQNFSQATRELQLLLDTHASRVVPSESVPGVYESLRSRVHRVLLGSDTLLERYRTIEESRAAQLLAEDHADEAETTRLLTASGFDAALRVAQQHLEAGRFHAARLTLEQLESHPDRKTAPRAGAAADMLALVARYLEDAPTTQRAARWMTEAGRTQPLDTTPIDKPAVLALKSRNLLGELPAIDPQQIPLTPIWSSVISPVSPSALGGNEEAEDSPAGLWILPTVVGDTIYLNDGRRLSARDRFTLRTRWEIKPPLDSTMESEAGGEEPRIFASAIEDTSSITLAGRVLVATTGFLISESRDGDPRTHAIDASTGRVLWSVDVGRVHPQLDGAIVRGPVVIEGDTAIVLARRPLPAQRVQASYLVGLDLNDGSPRWIRLIASAGVTPGGRDDRRMTPAILLHRGVVHVTDDLGVVAAVEAGTGRAIWVKPAPLPNESGESVRVSILDWPVPIAHGEGVITILPDRSRIVSLDATTGRELASRPAAEFSNPKYLVRAGHWLAAVGDGHVSVVDADDLSLAPITLASDLNVPLRGRLGATDASFVASLDTGIAIVNAAAPATPAVRLAIKGSGHALPLGDQLLLLSGASRGTLASYVTWASASSILKGRMEADPADPDPAITYLEMASRAGQGREIAPAADAALLSIERQSNINIARSARHRLFASLREMCEASLDPEAQASGAHAVLDTKELAGVVERLGRSAQDHDERATFLLVQGQLRTREDRLGVAIESYQRILDDAALARAAYRRNTIAVQAGLEATRLIRDLVRRHGWEIYRPFDTEASGRRAMLTGSPNASVLEALARQFPASMIAPELWSQAAQLHEQNKAWSLSIAALDEGMASAELLLDSGAPGTTTAATPLGAIAGRLVAALERSDQHFAAAQLIDRLRAQRPGLILDDGQGAKSMDEWSAMVTQRLASLRRLPHFGPTLSSQAQVLDGWAIMAPISIHSRAIEHVMLESKQEGMVALWSIAASQGSSSDPAQGVQHLRKLWSRPFKPGQGPRLLMQTLDAVYLVWDRTGQGQEIERIDAVAGTTRFTTKPFNLALSEIQPAPAPNGQPAAPTVIQHAGGVMAYVHEQAIVMAERGAGRVVAYATDTGDILWKLQSPIGWITDMTVGSGVVAIAGEERAVEGRGGKPTIAIHDLRTGQVRVQFDQITGPVRWLRITPKGMLVAGTDRGVHAFSMTSQSSAWDLLQHEASETLDAWVVEDRLYLLDEQRGLWQAALDTGALLEEELQTNEHFNDGSILATSLENHRTAFSTSFGVCVFLPSGRLQGIDGIGSTSLFPPQAAQTRFVALETSPRILPDGRQAYPLWLPDSESCQLHDAPQLLVLGERPRRMMVLDERLVVTAGNLTLVYRSPRTNP